MNSTDPARTAVAFIQYLTALANGGTPSSQTLTTAPQPPVTDPLPRQEEDPRVVRLLADLRGQFPQDTEDGDILPSAAHFLMVERLQSRSLCEEVLRRWSENRGAPWAIQEIEKALDGWVGAQESAQRAARELAAVRKKFEIVTAAELGSGREATHEWLIEGVLLGGQPGFLAGPEKSLKTSLALDAGISLASGKPFLGEFPVPRGRRVLVFSGESGQATVKEKIRLICQAKGVGLADVERMFSCGFRIPHLADPQDLADLQVILRQEAVEVVFIDPLYLCLLVGDGESGKGQASNRHVMGPLFASIAQVCLSAGATPVLVDHTLKRRGRHPLSLGDLAWAGPAEFARQWILVNHRRPYDPQSGTSQLWLTIGGSAGHAGVWQADIEEGQLAGDLTGRRWLVKRVQRDDGTGLRQQGRAARNSKDAAAGKVLAALDRLTKKHGSPPSCSAVKQAAKLYTDEMKEALADLTAEGIVEVVEIQVAIGKGGKRRAKALRRCKK
jgi:hypothetical protein